MRYRAIGRSGIEASVVALGSGGMGSPGRDRDNGIRTIHRALDAGITLIDTAASYAFGDSERLVGEAIRGRRDKVVLATKAGVIWHTAKGTHIFDLDDYHGYKYLGPESIQYEVEQSLLRLGTDYIDLYQMHWPDVTTPAADSMAAFVKLREQGKIRAIGLSNADVPLLEAFLRAGQVDSTQEEFNMVKREPADELLPCCRARGMAVLAYSPSAQGLLTGKSGPDRVFAEGDHRRDSPMFSVENRRKVARLLAATGPIAEDHGITPAQLTIAWTISQPGLTHAVVGAKTPEQAEENAAAGDVVLSEDELATINEAIDREWEDK